MKKMRDMYAYKEIYAAPTFLALSEPVNKLLDGAFDFLAPGKTFESMSPETKKKHSDAILSWKKEKDPKYLKLVQAAAKVEAKHVNVGNQGKATSMLYVSAFHKKIKDELSYPGIAVAVFTGQYYAAMLTHFYNFFAVNVALGKEYKRKKLVSHVHYDRVSKMTELYLVPLSHCSNEAEGRLIRDAVQQAWDLAHLFFNGKYGIDISKQSFALKFVYGPEEREAYSSFDSLNMGENIKG